MKKWQTVLLIATLIAVFLVSCGKDEPVTPTTSSQIVLAWASFDSSYYDYEADSTIFTPNIAVNGVVLGATIPTMDYVKVNGTTFSDDSFFIFGDGFTTFGGGENNNVRVLSPATTQLTVEVEASGGTISGSMSLPTLSGFPYQEGDSIARGATLTLNWTSNATYCELELYGGYYDTTSWTYNDIISIDTFLTVDTYSIPGSLLDFNGGLNIYLRPINGVFPGAGEADNMSGDGTGFVYYENSAAGIEGIDLVVGDGGPYMRGRPVVKHSSTPEEKLRKIARKLGLDI